jgi:hypothetical protein
MFRESGAAESAGSESSDLWLLNGNSPSLPTSKRGNDAIVKLMDGPSVSQIETFNMSTEATSPGVFELKFLVSEQQGAWIREWARSVMQPDPHAANGLDCGYWVNSLYLDTPDFGVLNRGEGHRQRKYRLRRYGTETSIWMELKQKSDGRVSKRRVCVGEAELPARLNCPGDEEWAGYWFQERLKQLLLRPVCQVTYQRFACVGKSPFGATRLTMDSQLCCVAAQEWDVPSRPLKSNSLLGDRRILELKFYETIPIAFRDLIVQLNLNPATFSKYRRSVDACIPTATYQSRR